MNVTPNLTLWGVGTSRTIRPHWAMHELGLSYKSKPIGPRTGETKTAEYTRLNPRQKIPLLQDGDFCIGESAAIVAYLSRTYSTPDRSLIPATQREFAAWLEWCFFIVADSIPPASTSCAAIAQTHWATSMELRPKSSHKPASIFGNSCDTLRWRWQMGGRS
jgi:glutathione S-transferase